MPRDRIDDISGFALFFSSLMIFAGLIMVARLLGNLFSGAVTGTDWVIGMVGAVIMYSAFRLPMQRLKNSVAAYPEQEKSIVNRFVVISIFLFILTGGLNMWAWNSDHKGTYTYKGPSMYIEDAQSRMKYSKEIKRYTAKSTSKDVIALRFIITLLTFATSLMYFVLLIQLHEETGKKRLRTSSGDTGRKRIR